MVIYPDFILQLELPYIDNIERAKRPQRIPVVFTREDQKDRVTMLPNSTIPSLKLQLEKAKN
jgi:hypothetical protein